MFPRVSAQKPKVATQQQTSLRCSVCPRQTWGPEASRARTQALGIFCSIAPVRLAQIHRSFQRGPAYALGESLIGL